MIRDSPEEFEIMRIVRDEDEFGLAAEELAPPPPIEEFLVDMDQLDLETVPPDMRYLLPDKEAWIYEHGNILELVYVRPLSR